MLLMAVVDFPLSVHKIPYPHTTQIMESNNPALLPNMIPISPQFVGIL